MISRTALGAFLLALPLAGPVQADGLDCGKLPVAHPTADRELAEAITTSKASLDQALRDTVKRLRTQAVSNAMIVDHAVAAYCPLVAKDNSLSPDRKQEAVRRFASELTGYVYDPAQSDDAIILSLPVPVAVSAQIDVAAAKAGQTRDEWLTAVIKKSLPSQ